MKITDINIRKVKSNTNIKASVSITLNDCFVINNLKVIEGKYSTFVGMPSKKDINNNYFDIAHPINSETREYIQNYVLNAYYNLEND